MRARRPDITATLTREGVDVGYEVWEPYEESNGRTVVFAPMDTIIDSRGWKAQIPFLARHARVVAIDGRGNGRSGRPLDPDAYSDLALAADLVAVLDEAQIDSAVLIGICTSAWVATVTAAQQPDRVRGLVAIAPWLPFVVPPHPFRAEWDFEVDYPDPQGWAKANRAHFERDFLDFAEFFFAELLPEPHSSKQWEDVVGWARGTSGQLMNASRDAPICVESAEDVHALLAAVRCPVLVINGDEDRCQPAERAALFAAATGADRLTLVGAGHLPMAREPVEVNLATRDFLDRVWPLRRTAVRPITSRLPRKVLYLSSPIGLGHSRRDMAIVAELQRLRPDVRVDWLAQQPLAGWLVARGFHVHPASAYLASEAAHIDSCAGEHDLHAFQAIREMDEILVANFMLFQEVVESEHYDLWVGDEAWELDYFLHENPRLKTSPYAWLTDFVGWLPMSDGREAELTADYNADMLEQIERLPRMRDRAVFVGNSHDVIAEPFGAGLPDIRAWTDEHFAYSGYVTGFDPAEILDRDALRAEFGFAPGEPVCLVTVGGSGVGTHLLRRAIDAYPDAARRVPGLRMVVVTGPRIDPRSLDAPAGVEVHGFLPDVHKRLAAADFAVVQGGLTTTMELTAARRPFVYVPLRNHFEQNRHVRHRLANYHAGTCVLWDQADPDHLAELIAKEIGAEVDFRPVETDGAARAAALLAELL